ncbi:MAG: hypothetical protein AAF431_19795 [Pseudomonadota bacterium]
MKASPSDSPEYASPTAANDNVRIVTADIAASIVGATSVVMFKREVKQGIWPPPHPKTLQRKRKGWDRVALERAIDDGSASEDSPKTEQEELLKGLGIG